MSDLIRCLACAGEIPDDAPTFRDVNGWLCRECAPTYVELLGDNESFVDEDDEPMTREARRAWFDSYVASGGKPSDSMAS